MAKTFDSPTRIEEPRKFGIYGRTFSTSEPTLNPEGLGCHGHITEPDPAALRPVMSVPPYNFCIRWRAVYPRPRHLLYQTIQHKSPSYRRQQLPSIALHRCSFRPWVSSPDRHHATEAESKESSGYRHGQIHAKGRPDHQAHPAVSSKDLSYTIVEDVAKDGAFDKAVQSDPLIEAVVHTASPFHYKPVDVQRDLMAPAVNGTLGLLKAIHKSAPSVKKVVITSSFAAVFSPNESKDVYRENDWNPVTMEDALRDNM